MISLVISITVLVGSTCTLMAVSKSLSLQSFVAEAGRGAEAGRDNLLAKEAFLVEKLSMLICRRHAGDGVAVFDAVGNIRIAYELSFKSWSIAYQLRSAAAYKIAHPRGRSPRYSSAQLRARFAFVWRRLAGIHFAGHCMLSSRVLLFHFVFVLPTFIRSGRAVSRRALVKRCRTHSFYIHSCDYRDLYFHNKECCFSAECA